MKPRKRVKTKKERDIDAAGALASAYVALISYFLDSGNFGGFIITTGAFIGILIASYKVEAAERRYDKIRRAYDEQILRPSAASESESSRTHSLAENSGAKINVFAGGRNAA